MQRPNRISNDHEKKTAVREGGRCALNRGNYSPISKRNARSNNWFLERVDLTVTKEMVTPVRSKDSNPMRKQGIPRLRA
jgi:hypothetical protein